MGEDKGSRMRDYTGRQDPSEILPSTIAAANPGVRNGRTPVARGVLQGDENARRRHSLAVEASAITSEPRSPHQDVNRLRITMRPSAITNLFPAVLGPCSSGRIPACLRPS